MYAIQSSILALLTVLPQEGAAEKLEVVTTLNVLKSLAEEVGGDRVHAVSLSDPRQDPHYVEPKPTLMQKAREADLFVEVGLQLELWAEKVASGSGNPKIQSGQPGRVVASTGVQTLELPSVLSREWGDVHPYGNPHIWLDPLNAKKMAETICTALCKIDAAHADEYQARSSAFQHRIDESLFGADLVQQVGGEKLSRLARQGRLAEFLESRSLTGSLGGWLQKAKVLTGRPVITYHKTCIYFADRFGFTIPIEIEEKPGIPPSARHRDQVVELIRARGVHTILQEIFYDRAAADYLAQQTGVHVVTVPLDLGSEVGIEDYFGLIEHLLDGLLDSEKGSG